MNSKIFFSQELTDYQNQLFYLLFYKEALQKEH